MNNYNLHQRIVETIRFKFFSQNKTVNDIYNELYPLFKSRTSIRKYIKSQEKDVHQRIPHNKTPSNIENYILNLVLQNPTIYLYEIKKSVLFSFEYNISISTICRIIKVNKITRKKCER